MLQCNNSKKGPWRSGVVRSGDFASQLLFQCTLGGAVIQHIANTGFGRFSSSLAVNDNQTHVTDRTVIDATARVNYFGSYTSVFDPTTSGAANGPARNRDDLEKAAIHVPTPLRTYPDARHSLP